MKRLATLVAVGSIACGSTAPPPRPPPMPVPVVTVAPTELVDSTEYLAQLRSRTAPAIRPQVDGQVTAILVKPGDVVTAGQPLLRIDPARQTAAVAQTQAAQGARRASLELAERNLARVRELVGRGALPEQELDNALAAERTARADVLALGAQIRGSRVELGYYQIAAPTAGVVGDIPVRVGDRVTPTTQVTSVADIRVLEANVAVPVGRAGDVRLGSEVRIIDDAGNPIAAGRISFVAPEVSPESQSVLIKADIDNARGALRADQVVRARVVWRRHPGIAVPALAVTWLGGQSFVYVVQAAGSSTVARQRPVQLGELAGSTYPVTSGLQPGEQIVAGGIQKLRDGAPIVAQAAGAGAGAAQGKG
jgi:RND family efflux transporter MFP subunit